MNMSNVKFMAWDKISKFIRSGVYLYMSGKGQIFSEMNNKVLKNITKETIILQFTGKCDRKEKEIYCGHILKFIDKMNQVKIGYVEYFAHESRFRIVVPWLDKDINRNYIYDDIYIEGKCDGSYYGLHQVIEKEIIGTIHKNPELLK